VTTAESDPFQEWLDRRARSGASGSLIDLYSIVADRRGVAAHELSLVERRILTERALPVLYPGFEFVESGSASGRDDPIEVVPYDAEWSSRYEAWRVRLIGRLGTRILRVEHVGSTSVPGLPAKPVVDIQVSVQDHSREEPYAAAIEQLGLQLRSRDDEHRYFRPFPGSPRDVQVHVCAIGSGWERRHLLFRDYLRAHPDARRAYATVKMEAAERWRDDRIAYTEAKGAVIRSLIAQADQWAATSGWIP
jgi:GrpB-like predicted nucleotidyltransferase (UPF0157 family)